MKKYGLQLRVPPSQQKKPAGRPPLPPPRVFDDDDDEDDVESDISRQASKNKSLKDVEEQHKKALDEDPSVLDYDGVYDEMKDKVVRPHIQDRQERKPKYVHSLIKKAEQRKWEQGIVYERKLVKERNKEDHLYADKDKFVTSAYKKKLVEQAKWLEEERLRQLREESDDEEKVMGVKVEAVRTKTGQGLNDGEGRRVPRKKEKSVPSNSKKMMGRGVKRTIQKVNVVQLDMGFGNGVAEFVSGSGGAILLEGEEAEVLISRVSDKEFDESAELLMRELLKLDGVEAEGEAKFQRKAEVRRVQNFQETLNELKARNSNPFSNRRKAVSVKANWLNLT